MQTIVLPNPLISHRILSDFLSNYIKAESSFKSDPVSSYWEIPVYKQTAID